MDSNFTKSFDPLYGRTNSRSPDSNDDRDSWRVMVQRIYTDITMLLQREGQLIRSEMTEKVVQVKAATFTLVASWIVLFIGSQCLAAAAIMLLSMVIPLWVSAVIVTAAFLISGVFMFFVALKKINTEDLKPRKSIEAFDHIRFSLKEKVHEITKH
jgi:hypothetical protein